MLRYCFLFLAILSLILLNTNTTSAEEFSHKWGSQGSESGQLHIVTDLDIDSEGNVYVADAGNVRIQKFSSDGTFLTMWGSGGIEDGQFQRGHHLAIDSNDYVYVSDIDNDRIQKFSNDGEFVKSWKVNVPLSIAINSFDEIYVYGSDSIWIFSTDGDLLTSWKPDPNQNGKFVAFWGMEFDSQDNLYAADVSNIKIQKFTSDGKYLEGWGSSGTENGRFGDAINGIAIDSSDNIYVADSDNYRIQKFSNDGEFINTFDEKGTENYLIFPRGIAIDSSDTIYVGSQNNISTFKQDSNGFTSTTDLHFTSKELSATTSDLSHNLVAGVPIIISQTAENTGIIPATSFCTSVVITDENNKIVTTYNHFYEQNKSVHERCYDDSDDASILYGAFHEITLTDPGIYTVKMTLDYKDQIDESDESNNESIRKITINPSDGEIIKIKEGKIYKNLVSLESTMRLGPVFKIDTNMFENDLVTLSIISDTITFKTISLEKENESEFIWRGQDTVSSSYVTIIGKGDNVGGNIHVKDKLYSIKAVGSGYHVVKEVNTEVFVDHLPGFDEEMTVSHLDWKDIYLDVSDWEYPVEIIDRNIHLMVLYTENVGDLLADADIEIDLASEETNDSHIMSDSDSRYKIVHRQEISYTSIGPAGDLDNMKDPLDDDLGFIHSLRDEHGADVVMLIIDIPEDGCGKAGSIGGDEDEAFVVVDYDCMTGYYSFGHELGHIHGARHIISQDSESIPFSFGHGYCDQNSPLNWRTIMAYNCAEGTGGNRQQYWSNPDITINGDVSGTIELQDNARVHDQTFEYVCSFRDPICRDQSIFLGQVEVLYQDYPFCFGLYPETGGLPQNCMSTFDPCGCGPQAPLCDQMQCSAFSELYEIVTFTQLQELRPYHLIEMGVDQSMILPREGMVLLDSDVRDKPIRITVESAEKLMSRDNSWFFHN